MKYKNKGFTLIEILAVVTIIGLIFILVIPRITTSLKNKKGDVDKTTENLVLSATKLYVSDHSSKFEKTDGNISCMPLHQLVKKGYLDGPVKNVTDDKDITNGKSVRITYNKGFKYELVDSNECKVYYCKSDYCDSDGNGYSEVEYLESTGTQYIDTLLVSSSSSHIYYDIDFEVLKTDTYTEDRMPIGGPNYAFNTYFLQVYNNKFYMFNINSNTNCTELHNRVKFYLEKWYINDSLIDMQITYPSRDINIYLFRWGDKYSKNKLYKCTFYDKNGLLIRDYIPVIDSSERSCLFDKVSRECYYNQGTGEFLWG